MLKVKWIDDGNRVRTDRIRDEYLDKLEAAPLESRSETLADILAWRHYRLPEQANERCLAIDILEPANLAGSYSVQVKNRVVVEVAANLLEAISAQYRNRPKVKKTWVPVHEALKVRNVWEEEIRSKTVVRKRGGDVVVAMTPDQIEALKVSPAWAVAAAYPDLAKFKGKRLWERVERSWARDEREAGQMKELLDVVEAQDLGCTVRMSRCGYTGEIGVVLEVQGESATEDRASFEEQAGIPTAIASRDGETLVTLAFIPAHMIADAPRISTAFKETLLQPDMAPAI